MNSDYRQLFHRKVLSFCRVLSGAFGFGLVMLTLLFGIASVSCSGSPSNDKGESSGLAEDGSGSVDLALLKRLQEPLFGDLNEIKKRRYLRVLISYSRTNYFYEGGQPRGFEADLVREYEKFLNQGTRDEYSRVKVVMIPTLFDHLISDLAEGKGDIATSGLTITDQRLEKVDFTEPYIPKVDEVLVTHRDVQDITILGDLAGRELFLRSGSSYANHVMEYNKKSAGAPIKIKNADRYLATEDILELVNAGIVPLSVADRHLAEIWSQVLPDITIRDDLVFHSGGQIGWAVRRDCPKLLSNLNSFIKKNKKGSLLGNILFKRYYKDTEWVKKPIALEDNPELSRLVELFKKYGEKYDIDWLALAAQGFQESGLDQKKRSRAGAVGIMQLLPSTAADSSVGIKNLQDLESNIHAGAKYVSYLRDRYFSDEGIEELDRLSLTWAAYNAGPGKVIKLRRRAEERGFDPDKWFANVEVIANEVVGREVVAYVSNVNKYYVAFKLAYEASVQRKAEREKLERAGAP